MAKFEFERIVSGEELKGVVEGYLGSGYRIEVKRHCVIIAQDVARGCLLQLREKQGRTVCKGPYAHMPSTGLRLAIFPGAMVLVLAIGVSMGHIVVLGALPIIFLWLIMTVPSRGLVKRVGGLLEKQAKEAFGPGRSIPGGQLGPTDLRGDGPTGRSGARRSQSPRTFVPEESERVIESVPGGGGPLREVYASWTIDELVRATKTERSQYTEDGLAAMEDVLRARGVSGDRYEQIAGDIQTEQARAMAPPWEGNTFRAAHPVASFLADRRRIFAALLGGFSYIWLETTLLSLRVISEGGVWVLLFYLSLLLLLGGAYGAYIYWRHLFSRTSLGLRVYVVWLLGGVLWRPIQYAMSPRIVVTPGSPQLWMEWITALLTELVPSLLAPAALVGVLSLERRGWQVAVAHRTYLLVLSLIYVGDYVFQALRFGLHALSASVLTILLCVFWVGINGYWLSVLRETRSLFTQGDRRSEVP